MTSHYRRSDYANLLLVSGLLTFVAAIAALIMKPGDAQVFKTIVVVVLFALTVILLTAHSVVNSIGDSVSITDKIMTIKSNKEFVFISDESAHDGKTIPRHRNVAVDLNEIEDFAVFDGKEIYEHSFQKNFPMHLKMRPMIVDSFIGDMLISLVKVAPGHISMHYDRETEDVPMANLDKGSMSLLSACHFLVFNLKDKRQIIFYLKGYDMIDVFSFVSHIVKKSHMYPISLIKFPELNYKNYRFNKRHRVFIALGISIVPTVLLMSVFLFIEREPNDIFFYLFKTIPIVLSALFGLRIYIFHAQALYRSKMKRLGIILERSSFTLFFVDLALLTIFMILAEYLLLAINT